MYVEPELKRENASALKLISPRKKGLIRQDRSFSSYLRRRCAFFINHLKPRIKKSDSLRFEISIEKMNELLSQRQICAADIRCLDINSKQCLKDLCLNTCLYIPTPHS